MKENREPFRDLQADEWPEKKHCLKIRLSQIFRRLGEEKRSQGCLMGERALQHL